MSLRNQLMASATAFLAALNPISNAQAMNDATTVGYRGPFFKEIVSAADDELASGAASGIALKFEEASRNNPTKPEIVQDARGKYWFGAVVGDKQIAGCGAHLNEDRKTVGPAFVKFAIDTQTGAVEVSKIDGDCKEIIKAARDAMTQKMAPQPSQREGESSSNGRIKQHSPE